MSEKIINKIGWFASIMATIMYLSYIDQIKFNLAGQKGSLLLPLATVVNCIAWTTYGLIKPKKDWPIIFCNSLGIVVAGITAITAIF